MSVHMEDIVEHSIQDHHMVDEALKILLKNHHLLDRIHDCLSSYVMAQQMGWFLVSLEWLALDPLDVLEFYLVVVSIEQVFQIPFLVKLAQ